MSQSGYGVRCNPFAVTLQINDLLYTWGNRGLGHAAAGPDRAERPPSLASRPAAARGQTGRPPGRAKPGSRQTRPGQERATERGVMNTSTHTHTHTQNSISHPHGNNKRPKSALEMPYRPSYEQIVNETYVFHYFQNTKSSQTGFGRCTNRFEIGSRSGPTCTIRLAQ